MLSDRDRHLLDLIFGPFPARCLQKETRKKGIQLTNEAMRTMLKIYIRIRGKR